MSEPRRAVDILTEHIELSGARVIDVGSGEGGLVRWLRGQGADAVGVECGEEMLRRAKAADPDHLEAHIDGVGQDLPFDDASALGFSVVADGSFISQSIYADFAAWEHGMVGIDPGRARAFDQHRAEVQRRFDAIAEPTDKGLALTQPNTFQVLQRPDVP